MDSGRPAFGGGTQKYNYYSPKISGREFIYKGGYAGQFNRQNAESIRVANVEKHQMANARHTTYLTAILAVAAVPAALYYIVELVKNEYQIYSVGVLTIAFVSLFCVIAVLIIQKIVKRQE